MSITYPWFLLGLLGIAIPVLIHLFELRRPTRVLFTNLGFIREVQIVTAKQRKVKHWLVLLARIGFVIFLVFMFAQPFLPAQVASSASRRIDPSVLVDTSPSMQADEEGSDLSRFDKAVDQARELPMAFPANARFTLNKELNVPLAPAAFRVALDQLSVSGRSTGLNGLLQKSIGQPDKAKQLFVFSDFQKSVFSSRSLAAVDSAAQVLLVPVGGGGTRNVFIDSLWLEDAFVRRNADVVLHVRLRNGGTEAVKNCQLRLFVGTRQATAFNASVSGDEPVTVTARVRLDSDQVQLCRIELDDFPVVFDNTYYFSLQASPVIRVLEVQNGGQEQALQRVYGNEPLFSYSQTVASRLDYGQLEKANLLVVRGASRIEAALREGIRRVVQRGGSVVVIPPADVTGRATYDQLFRELGIAPVQWEAAGTRTALREVAVPDRRNPFFREVFGAQSRQPVMPKVAPVLRWSRSGTDIMRTQDGDGFLSAFSSGKGTLYLFSTPFNESSTDFLQHALFVPVMYRLAMQSFRSEQHLAYRLNQGSVTVAVGNGNTAAQAGEQVYKLTNDSLTFIPAQRVQNGLLRFEVPAGMQQPGFYRLTRNGQTLTPLAFNNDKRESELAAYTAAELRQLIGPNRPNVQVYETGQGLTVAARYKAERVGTPLWQYCLWAALACLLAEVLLLRFMGRPAAAADVKVAA
ncbi:BatA domain-containing protein [Hymenobacter canadensis]|uniref:BatA domain-containing protein n=1 Tax=Hymenobacter canadensis TaxID=2999067 RepID=A0ABY7LTL2_9BACT|nr:BatA domain-containing protein [Hymenobacter canadensis]WBA43753.1 BatA domain-containing protein [Hymenobacter canadensis]